MEIRVTKTGKEEQVFSCMRKNGSVTWKQVSGFFILHDLCHYAVETVLPLPHAFLGMVAAGTDITAFDQPREQRSFELNPEAIMAEQLVNLLVIDFTQGRLSDLVGIFNDLTVDELSLSLRQRVTAEKIDLIRQRYAALVQEWNSLPVAQTLLLLFED
jgi:hypothetical protein